MLGVSRISAILDRAYIVLMFGHQVTEKGQILVSEVL